MFVRVNDAKTEKKIRAIAKEKSTSLTGAVAFLVSGTEPTTARNGRITKRGVAPATKRATAKRKAGNKASAAKA